MGTYGLVPAAPAPAALPASAAGPPLAPSAAPGSGAVALAFRSVPLAPRLPHTPLPGPGFAPSIATKAAGGQRQSAARLGRRGQISAISFPAQFAAPNLNMLTHIGQLVRQRKSDSVSQVVGSFSTLGRQPINSILIQHGWPGAGQLAGAGHGAVRAGTIGAEGVPAVRESQEEIWGQTSPPEAMCTSPNIKTSN